VSTELSTHQMYLGTLKNISISSVSLAGPWFREQADAAIKYAVIALESIGPGVDVIACEELAKLRHAAAELTRLRNTAALVVLDAADRMQMEADIQEALLPNQSTQLLGMRIARDELMRVYRELGEQSP